MYSQPEQGSLVKISAASVWGWKGLAGHYIMHLSSQLASICLITAHCTKVVKFMFRVFNVLLSVREVPEFKTTGGTSI